MPPKCMEVAARSQRDDLRKTAELGGQRAEDTAQPKKFKPWARVRILPDGDAFVVEGRPAQTLLALKEAGACGLTSGEFSRLKWARRVSDAVFKLRAAGFVISTTREDVGDAIVGRYRLESRVTVLGTGGEQ